VLTPFRGEDVIRCNFDAQWCLQVYHCALDFVHPDHVAGMPASWTIMRGIYDGEMCRFGSYVMVNADGACRDARIAAEFDL